MLHIACDVHTHTIFSRHAYSTIEENVRAAAEMRVELLGSTDHFSAMVHPAIDGEYDLRDFQHFLNVHSWPRIWKHWKKREWKPQKRKNNIPTLLVCSMSCIQS